MGLFVLVIMADLRRRARLRGRKACALNFVVNELASWCGVPGLPPTWVSNNAPHSKNRVLFEAAWTLRVNRSLDS